MRLHAEELRHPAGGPRPGSRGAPPGEGDLVWREVRYVPAEARLDGGWVALAPMRCIVCFQCASRIVAHFLVSNPPSITLEEAPGKRIPSTRREQRR